MSQHIITFDKSNDSKRPIVIAGWDNPTKSFFVECNYQTFDGEEWLAWTSPFFSKDIPVSDFQFVDVAKWLYYTCC
ncbi:hypothetical protein [Enterovibrio norvegicus]|uniref:hypothetical protein n=1 Tax=Enterovibrio norvegicus TaxID=188144 RepID=UPI00352E9D25